MLYVVRHIACKGIVLELHKHSWYDSGYVCFFVGFWHLADLCGAGGDF